MEEMNERRIIYYEDEAHLIRRLGAAVVVVWTTLDQDTRDLITDRAERVLDKEEADSFESDLQRLIANRCHKGSRPSRSAPALAQPASVAAARRWTKGEGRP